MQATAKTTARVSLKHCIILCKAIRGKRVINAKKLLQNLIDKKESIDGKYYTKASKHLLELLESAEANAKQKGINEEKIFVKVAKADKGYTFILPKSRAKFRGRKAKVTNLEIVVSER
jgi:large subunit ribosomal protein L22